MDRFRLTGLVAVALAALLAAGPAAHAQYRLEFGYCDSLQAQYLAAVQRAGDAGMTGQKMVQIDALSRQLAQAQRRCPALRLHRRLPLLPAAPQPAMPGDHGRREPAQPAAQPARAATISSSSAPRPRPRLPACATRSTATAAACRLAGGTRTLCVRLCDGYYFPIEYDAASSRFDTDATVCQSLYAEDGQAELFVQANDDDVANATSLSGQRYGDQPYAFLYRQSYAPACVAELHAGMTALARRYFALLPPQRLSKLAGSPHAPRRCRLPQLRRPCLGGPGDACQRRRPLHGQAGDAPRVALADAPAKPVRMVGPAYYADMFDLSKARKKQASLRRSLVDRHARRGGGSAGDRAGGRHA